MTHVTRVEAFLAAHAKTVGRQFDAAGRPILSFEEAFALEIAKTIDSYEARERHAATLAEVARLEALDAQVS